MSWTLILMGAFALLGFLLMRIDYLKDPETVKNWDIKLERFRSLAEHGMSSIFHFLLYNKPFRLLLALFLFIELILIDAFDRVYDSLLIIITILGFCIISLFPILILIIRFLQIVTMIFSRLKKGTIKNIGFILAVLSITVNLITLIVHQISPK